MKSPVAEHALSTKHKLKPIQFLKNERSNQKLNISHSIEMKRKHKENMLKLRFKYITL